jgi:hypothetical protein
MTCSEFKDRLDAYGRDTLPAAETVAFEGHLSGCVFCAELLESVAAPVAGTVALPRSVDPGADLWPEISARLTPRRSAIPGRLVLPRWLLAAAAVLLVSLSSGITAIVLRGGPAVPVPAEPARLGAQEAEYAVAAADLTRTLEQARGRLAPATIATIRRNLATIDSALAESRRALARDPDNSDLEELVLTAWRQKVDLLRRAAALSTES